MVAFHLWLCYIGDNGLTESIIVRCSISRFNLAETLVHKLERYRAQRRITTSTVTIPSNGETIAERIAAASIDENGFADDGHPRSRDGEQSSRKQKGSTRVKSPIMENKHRVELKLIAHVHEHADKITKLVPHPDKNHFVSCSGNDVRLWSASSFQEDSSHPAWMSLDALKFRNTISCPCNHLSTYQF